MVEKLNTVELKECLSQAKVSGLYEYPVKSMGGFSVESAWVMPRGFMEDRQFMVVASIPFERKGKQRLFNDVPNAFVTQRELPKLALITPFYELRSRTEQVVFSAPDRELFTVPVLRDGEGEDRNVTIWEDTSVTSIDQGDEIAAWLSDFLQVSGLRLVRMRDDYVRQVDQQYAHREHDEVGFADGYPFLLISEESLQDLNHRIQERNPDDLMLPMNRFRPNIVIKGSGVPYGEDSLRKIKIGKVIFEIVKPCARCITTQTDQETAKQGSEPMKTLLSYRAVTKDTPGLSALFGQNLTHEGNGVIRVGDGIEVLEVGDPIEFIK